jgi:hypothetical protein
MFSVAMTLLATTLILPVQSLTGSAFSMLHDIGGALSSVVLSFAISSRYWLSQRRQLTMTSVVTPRQTGALRIPISHRLVTNLDGSFRSRRDRAGCADLWSAPRAARLRESAAVGRSSP